MSKEEVQVFRCYRDCAGDECYLVVKLTNNRSVDIPDRCPWDMGDDHESEWTEEKNE